VPQIAAVLSSGIVAGITSGRLGKDVLRAGLTTAATTTAFMIVGGVTSGMPGAIPGVDGSDGTFDPFSGAHLANIAGHALIGCGQAAASGGKCGAGALAGAVTSAAGLIIDGTGFRFASLATNAALGGGVAVLGGGKFENGAITGAFGYLFNHLGHMLVGTDAHYQLLRYLQGEEPGMWSGNIGFDGLFGSGRPDLVYDAAPFEIYEIKSVGSDAAGRDQLQEYLNASGSQAIPGNFLRVFGQDSSIRLTGGWFGETTYTYSPGAFEGVIIYNVDQRSVFEQALKLFFQNPVGGPLPLPPRMPPILVP
jgi:hypothetical protein